MSKIFSFKCIATSSWYPVVVLVIVFATSTTTLAQQSADKPKTGPEAYGLKQYFLLHYLKGPKRMDPKDTARLNPLQRAHLLHIDDMAAAGKVLMAGPIAEEGDLRGILIMSVPTKQEAEAIGNADPLVKVGHLRYEVKPWWTMPGSCLK